jgi:pseudaminic acid cytidylyltransferase
MNNIPILIPVKEVSVRCPEKNRKLLPYTARYLQEQGLIANSYVISDSQPLLEFSSSLGFKTFFEVRKETQDELQSCSNFATAKKEELFFLCPVTQPFRSPDLFELCFNKFTEYNTRLDFVTSVSLITNREKFYLEFINNQPQFVINSANRKGAVCSTQYMIDGCLYLVRASFMNKVITSGNPNAFFWNGKFQCVQNGAPFIDIDTILDMERFEFLRRFFSDE